MSKRPFTLRDFVRESNRIEGIPRVLHGEVTAHQVFLLEGPNVGSISALVRAIGGGPLRNKPGMDVRVGRHLPQGGGIEVEYDLLTILTKAVNNRDGRWTPYQLHCEYETLHPFMDGNGRSGRVLWLWMMGGIDRAPLGFLHHWYYQSLEAGQARKRATGHE